MLINVLKIIDILSCLKTVSLEIEILLFNRTIIGTIITYIVQTSG